MPDEGEEDKKSVAGRPRNSDGKFTSKPKEPKAPTGGSALPNPLVPSLKSTKNDETLISVEVGNPLRRITQLLEQIKKQKAFSFTLKGSLGVMGVVLALSLFGLFGGSKMLCDKGIQTQSGTVKILMTYEVEPSTVPLIGPIIDYTRDLLSLRSSGERRVILHTSSGTLMHLPRDFDVDLNSFANQAVYATGQYDSCSQVLRVKEASAMERIQ